MNKNIEKTTTQNICDEYRELLKMPELTDKEVEEMRHNLKLIATTICEHVWKKKFY
jgi:glucuronate isomerase